MHYIEFIILGIIILASVSYGVYYIYKFFSAKNDNPCHGCPYADVCSKPRKDMKK